MSKEQDIEYKTDALQRLSAHRDSFGPAIAAMQAPFLTPEAFAERGFAIEHLRNSQLKQWWSADGRIGICMYPSMLNTKLAPLLSFMQYKKTMYYTSVSGTETALDTKLQWHMPNHEQVRSLAHFDELVAKMRAMLNTPEDAERDHTAGVVRKWDDITI